MRRLAAASLAPIVVLILILALLLLGVELLSPRMGAPPPLRGEPVRDPATGLYAVYVLVTGHRDLTPLHRNLRANIRIDFVSYYYSPPEPPPSGESWLDLGKSIHVTVALRGSGSNSTLVTTFDAVVSLGARWGRVLTYRLPRGTYSLEVRGTDQDGFTSSASAELILP